MAGSKDELFRVGHGYVDYWCHMPEHWNINDQERRAITDLCESLHRLIEKRDRVQTARRAFAPASSFGASSTPDARAQQELFDATHDFFQTYYSTLSSFAGVLTRFRDEVGRDVQVGSMAKFIQWLKPHALFAHEAIPLLEEARAFRALLDHKASHQPVDWSTMEDGVLVRAAFHGRASRSGVIPTGARLRSEADKELPGDDDWIFIAPDEDRVLAALAVQLNAVFPRIQRHRHNPESERGCQWQQPKDGEYPIYAAESGTVVFADPPPGQLSAESQRRISEILAPYFDEPRDPPR